MSYDLVAWPVDRAMTDEEARDQVERRMRVWRLGLRRDRRVDAFEKALRERLPGIGTPHGQFPIELNVHSDYVHLALPWSMVAGLVEAIAPIAFDAGLALFDPQRGVAALPAPFGTQPLGIEGIDQHERDAAQAMSAIIAGLTPGGPGWDPTVGPERTGAGEFKVMSPLGFEITPDIQAEVFANPLRVPTSLQTPERRASAIAQLGESRAGRRHDAAQLLGGWDPDPQVRAALLPILDDEDVNLVAFAAMGLANQGDLADLPNLLATVHRMSPADGGTFESMISPLMAAMRLAKRAGSRSVDDVRAKAREWRVAPGGAAGRRSMSDAEFERWLDDLSPGDAGTTTTVH